MIRARRLKYQLSPCPASPTSLPRGAARLEGSRVDEAVADFHTALSLQPRYDTARANLRRAREARELAPAPESAATPEPALPPGGAAGGATGPARVALEESSAAVRPEEEAAASHAHAAAGRPQDAPGPPPQEVQVG